MPNYEMMSVVSSFPKGRIVSEEDLKDEGADLKFLKRVNAIKETTAPLTNTELPLGPLGMGLVGEPPKTEEENDEGADIGTHLDDATGERVADMPASGAVKNAIVAEAKAPTVAAPTVAPATATKEAAPAAKGATGTKSVGVVPGK